MLGDPSRVPVPLLFPTYESDTKRSDIVAPSLLWTQGSRCIGKMKNKVWERVSAQDFYCGGTIPSMPPAPSSFAPPFFLFMRRRASPMMMSAATIPTPA